MQIKYNKFYHNFLSSFLLILLFYVLFFWGIGIIYPVKNFVFNNIILNMAYITLISFMSIFFVGVLIQILINFCYYQKSFTYCKLILKTNWLVILTWILNLLILTFMIYQNFNKYTDMIRENHLGQLSYLILLNLFYVLYLLIGLSVLASIILISIYYFYIKNITFFVDLKNNEIYNDLLQINLIEYLLVKIIIFFKKIQFLFITKFIIEITTLKDNLRKTKLLIQFKKENSPPINLNLKTIN